MELHIHGDNVHVIVHEMPDAGAVARHREVMAHIEALREQGVHMAETLASVKADLDEVKSDLDEIKTAVASALATSAAQAAKIVELQGVIDGLTAGDVLTQAGIDELKAASGVLKDQAESVAATLRPVAPPTP